MIHTDTWEKAKKIANDSNNKMILANKIHRFTPVSTGHSYATVRVGSKSHNKYK